MTTRNHFRTIMAARRLCRRGTIDHDWHTRAARKYVWLMRGVPVNEWEE